MKARTFNAVMSRPHELYCARVLGMDHNASPGPDLISDTAVVEVKSRLIHPDHPKKWVVQEHQMLYPKDHKGLSFYWALGFYQLNTPVRKIPHQTRNYTILENLVSEREIYLVPFDWMRKYKSHRCVGQTHKSQWDLSLRYSNFRDLPKIIKSIQGEKGPIHLTEGVFEKHFPKLIKPAIAA